MKARLEDKQRAINLRKQGYSYSKIQEIIPVSKSLLSGWFKYLELSTDELKKLELFVKENQDKGRIKSSLSNTNRRIIRENEVLEISKSIFNTYLADPEFIIGISLYWAEGSKRSTVFQFINSDPEMIKFMNKWVRKYLPIGDDKIKFRLFTHKIDGYELHERYWSDLLDLKDQPLSKTILKPTQHMVKKNPNYNGCLRIEITRIKYLWIMKNWQKLLIQCYGNL